MTQALYLHCGTEPWKSTRATRKRDLHARWGVGISATVLYSREPPSKWINSMQFSCDVPVLALASNQRVHQRLDLYHRKSDATGESRDTRIPRGKVQLERISVGIRRLFYASTMRGTHRSFASPRCCKVTVIVDSLIVYSSSRLNDVDVIRRCSNRQIHTNTRIELPCRAVTRFLIISFLSVFFFFLFFFFLRNILYDD